MYSLQMSGISNPSTVWSNPKDPNPQTTVYFNSFEAGGFCKVCLKILVRLRVITVQNAVLGVVTPCCPLSWWWRQNSSICLPDIMASHTRRECLLSQAFSWYFSWISSDPHCSGFKLYTAVHSILCVMFQLLLLLVVVVVVVVVVVESFWIFGNPNRLYFWWMCRVLVLCLFAE